MMPVILEPSTGMSSTELEEYVVIVVEVLQYFMIANECGGFQG
jgi:hypothetical protein